MEMMTSLFSIFDVGGAWWWLNWVAGGIPILIIKESVMNVGSGAAIVASSITSTVKGEMDSTLGGVGFHALGASIYMLLVGVVCMNLGGLLPYVFTCTSHLVVPLGCGGAWWWMVVARKMSQEPGGFMMSLVPVGTPPILMPAMVIIESISIIIRPITLSVRLMANMISGHLLLSLVGGGIGISIGGAVGVVGEILLCSLEMAVAIIQSYVFIVLLGLYAKES